MTLSYYGHIAERYAGNTSPWKLDYTSNVWTDQEIYPSSEHNRTFDGNLFPHQNNGKNDFGNQIGYIDNGYCNIDTNIYPLPTPNVPALPVSYVKLPFIRNNMVSAVFSTMTVPVLIDTGASISIVSVNLLNQMDPKLLSQITNSGIGRAIMADGNAQEIIGQIKLIFKLADETFAMEFQILPHIAYWAVLGVDFFQKHQCNLNFSDNIFYVNPVSCPNSVGIVPINSL